MLEGVPHPIDPNPPNFISQFRLFLRGTGKAYATEQTYVYWVVYFIRWSGTKHPKDMDEAEVSGFLNFLSVQQNTAPSTQRTALCALACLYNQFLKTPLENLSFNYARKSVRIPTVFTHEEAVEVISHLCKPYSLIAKLMYGSGLRISEATRLRVKDIDFTAGYIVVRNGKGLKDRTTLLPKSLID